MYVTGMFMSFDGCMWQKCSCCLMYVAGMFMLFDVCDRDVHVV